MKKRNRKNKHPKVGHFLEEMEPENTCDIKGCLERKQWSTVFITTFPDGSLNNLEIVLEPEIFVCDTHRHFLRIGELMQGRVENELYQLASNCLTNMGIVDVPFPFKLLFTLKWKSLNTNEISE